MRTRRHRTTARLVLTALLVAALIVACQPAAPQAGSGAATTIKVGKLSPITGSLALLGTQQLHGAELAVEEINAAGGIKSMGGANLELIVGDTQGSPETGVKEAERLMDEGAVALVGALQSGVGFPTTQAAARRGVPYLIDEGVSDSITARGFTNIFRITYSAYYETLQTVDWLKKISASTGEPITSLVVMHEDSLFGTTIVDTFVQNLQGSGIEVAERLAYPASTTDLSTEIAKAKASGADVLIHAGYLNDAILIARAAQEQQLGMPLFGLGSAGFSNPQFVQQVGEAAELALDLNLGVSLQKPQAAKMAEAYNSKYPNDGWNHHAVYSYTAVKVLADALERAGTTDSPLLLRALREMRFADHPLPQDLIIFDAKGENINAGALIFQVIDGKIEIVLPEEFATAKMIWPK